MAENKNMSRPSQAPQMGRPGMGGGPRRGPHNLYVEKQLCIIS